MKRVVVVLGVLTSLAAGAYVLPGGSILRRLVDAREELNLSSVKVDGSLAFQGPAAREAGAALGLTPERNELRVDSTLSLRAPGRCRWEARAPDGTQLAAVYASGRKRTEGSALPALSTALEQVCAVLAMRTRGDNIELREGLLRHLDGLDVEVKTTSLARLGGEVAYVLGEPSEDKPQFWVYKDSFRPARLRWKDKAGAAWDVRFLDFTSPVSAEGLPRTVELWRNGERALRFTTLQSDSRARLADSLF